MPTWDIVKYLLVFWSDVILPSNLQLCSTRSTQTLLYFFLIIWIWSFMPSILSQAFPAVSDVATNTDICQGIVSKLDISRGGGRPLLFSGSIEKTWREEGSPFFKLKRPAQTPDCSSRQERNNLLTDFKKSTKSRRVRRRAEQICHASELNSSKTKRIENRKSHLPNNNHRACFSLLDTLKHR